MRARIWWDTDPDERVVEAASIEAAWRAARDLVEDELDRPDPEEGTWWFHGLRVVEECPDHPQADVDWWTYRCAECDRSLEAWDDVVTLDPDEPDCEEDQQGHHDWQAPYQIVGGCPENPGVWGSGGGVIVEEVCMRCGTARVTDTWATDPHTGEQGLTRVWYEPDKHHREVSALRLDERLEEEGTLLVEDEGEFSTERLWLHDHHLYYQHANGGARGSYDRQAGDGQWYDWPVELTREVTLGEACELFDEDEVVDALVEHHEDAGDSVLIGLRRLLDRRGEPERCP
jgi:hypothetical protein